jgi:pilus assembly protein CpaB
MKFAIKGSWLILLVALGIGGLAAFGVNRYIKGRVDQLEAQAKGRKVRIVVPKEDLPKGTVLTAKLVAVREIPTEYAHTNAITPDQFERVENQKLAYPAARGEMLLWSLLEGERVPSFSSRLTPGHRAVTMQVDEVNSISGMLEPGDRIDLMVSVRKENHTYMFPLLQNVDVLATGARADVVAGADGKESRRSFTTITLEATPEDAQRVLAAREVGKVAAVLRSPGDSAVGESTRRDSLALLGLGGPAPATESTGVPVMYGGRGGSGGAGKPAPGLLSVGAPKLGGDGAN